MKKKQRSLHPNLNKIFFNYLNEQKKEKLIKSLHADDIDTIGQVLACISFSSEIELNAQKETPEYTHIHNLLKTSRTNQTIEPELTNIYKQRRTLAKNALHIQRGRITREILSDQLKNYKTIKRTKADIGHKLLISKINSAPIELKEKYDRLTNDLDLFDHNPMHIKLGKALLLAEAKSHDILSHAAFLILNPKNQFLSLSLCDKALNDFPLFWYIDHSPLNECKSLFHLHKQGYDLGNYFELKYKKPSGFEKINQLLESVYLQPPTTHLLCDRKNIIEQAMHCYKQNTYCAAICTSLILIEGLLWDFSVEIHLRHGGIYADDDCKEVVLTSGKQQSDPSIGLLLQQSKFRDYFDKKFIKYFCNELYTERNPILHGRELTLFTKRNASKKIATIEYILHLISENYKTAVHKNIDEAIPKELKEQMSQKI